MLRTCSDDRSAEFSILSVFKINCSLLFATWSSTPARCPRATIARSRFSRREDGTPRIFPRYSYEVILRMPNELAILPSVFLFQIVLSSKYPPALRYVQLSRWHLQCQGALHTQSHLR